MLKVRVLGLTGCSLCEALVTKLKKINIPYYFTDADNHPKLADMLEVLLNTQEYPMILVEDDLKTCYYIYRPQEITQLGIRKASDGCTAIGCATLDIMILNLKSILK